METLFNIAWAVLGLVGIATGLWCRCRVAPSTKREFTHHIVSLAVIVFLLLPIVSFSDDIGYFNYYFSHDRSPDSLFWVSGPRREKQLSWVPVLQVFGFLLLTTLGALYQRTFLGIVPVADWACTVDRSTATAYLRAPPPSLA